MASARTDRLPSIYRGFAPATTTSSINPLAGSRLGDRGRANSRDVGAVVAAASAAGSGTTATTAAAAAAAVGSGTVDRRRLWGVGTFLIDTPKDSALQVRQRLLSFQEQHRGPLGVKSPGEALPGIPFRLNPNPEVPQRSASDSHVPPVLMVDAATSPMMPFDEDSNSSSNLGPSETALSAPSTARSVTFLTDQDQDQDQEVTKLSSSLLGDKTTANGSANANANAAEFGKAKTVSILVKKASQGTSMRSLTMAVSFSERPPRKSIARRVRECSKIGIVSSGGSPGTTTTGTNTAITAAAEGARELQHHQQQQQQHHQQQQMQLPGPLSFEGYPIERLPRLPPDTARSRQTLLTNSPRKSASVSDLTDVGSIFSWHDMEFEVRTSRSFDMDSDNVGPTSFFQSRNKSKSLLDLLKLSRKGGRGGGVGTGEGGGAGGGGRGGGGEEDDSRKIAAADFSAAYHRRQRIAQLAFRRENSRLQRQPNGTLASSEADKEWLEMVNTQVIDKADYDKFASSRKPVTPAAGSSKKHAAYNGPYRPKSGTDFRLSQPAKGKVYPVFFNDGSPVRKFGRALPPKRKLFKSKQ